jgi:hypothetical protein
MTFKNILLVRHEHASEVASSIQMKTIRFLSISLFVILLLQFVVLADDRTMQLSIQNLQGNPPNGAVIGVTAGSATNQNPSTILFYVEYSDDLLSWTPLRSLDVGQTPTIATNLSNGQMAIFVDEHASPHRFYRGVQILQ